MVYVKLLAVIAVIASVAWYIAQPGFEPLLSGLASLSALATSFIVEKRNTRRVRQNQSTSQSSIGIQAGRDVSIKNVGGDKNVY